MHFIRLKISVVVVGMIALVGGFMGSTIATLFASSSEGFDSFARPLIGFVFGSVLAGFFGLAFVINANVRINELLTGGNKERDQEDND